MDISVLMPCYNEATGIHRNIDETVKTLKKSKNGSFELIVIDDGSLDRTFEEIKACARNNGFVKFIQLKKNHGKGHALKKGFENANGKYICFLDGDLDLHPGLIKSFIEILKKENADVVIGSKRHPLSDVNYPGHRKILSFGYQTFIKILFNLSIKDSQVGLKLFKREVLSQVFPRVLVKKYAFDIELLVNTHRKGYKIVEAPIKMDFNPRGSEVSPLSYTRMFIDTCAIFYRTHILHYYDRFNINIEDGYPNLLENRKEIDDKDKFIPEEKDMLNNKSKDLDKLVTKMKIQK